MTLIHPFIAKQVLSEVEFERAAQDARWGEQNHPDFVDLPGNPRHDTDRWRKRADAFKRENDVRVSEGKLAWDGILLEEVYESLSESDPARLRAELIQVAAVAVAWIESIDRREFVYDDGEAKHA